MELGINDLTVDVFLDLYTSVGWEPPCREQVETALRGSVAAFTFVEDGRPVAMARLIGDGGMSFYIKDFAVRPSCQGKGIGALLIHVLEGYIRESISPDWAVSLELISTREAVSFYRKMGFEERPCDWNGPGMFKMLR